MFDQEFLFSKMSIEERINYLKEHSPLTDDDLKLIHDGNGLTLPVASSMIENVIGIYSLPYSIAPGFLINGKELSVPMVGEEPYVPSSTSNGALLAKKNGGFIASNTGSVMIGQVQLSCISNPYTAKLNILENKREIIEIANRVDPVLISFGGGCIDVEAYIRDSPMETFLVVHLIINVKDAMGAQAINAMTEAVSNKLEELSGGIANIKVLSNLAIYRIVRSRVKIKKEDIGGEACVDKIVSAWEFARADQFRATTHNKGVMNGIIPVVIATGNDTRAVESGVHSYACYGGKYKPVTTWEKNNDGDLEGMIEVPMAVGIVGGTTKIHPLAQLSLKLMDVHSATELAEIIASVGLAANLGVLHSLVTAGLYGDFNAARK